MIILGNDKKSQPNVEHLTGEYLRKWRKLDVIISIHPSLEKHKSHDRKRLWFFILCLEVQGC